MYNGEKRHIRIRYSVVKTDAKTWCHLHGICEIREKLSGSTDQGLEQANSSLDARGMELKPVD